MSGRITRTVIESFLKCKTKARLKVQGEHGVPSDYELFLLEKRCEARRRAIEGILAKLGDQHAAVLRILPATIPLLRQGAEYVLDTSFEGQSISISFDALKKVSGASSLGDFHYVPVLFQEGTRSGGISVCSWRSWAPCWAISRAGSLKSASSSSEIECRGAKVRLTGSLRERARDILREIQESLGDVRPPRLMLNSHCQQCEFRELPPSGRSG